MYSLALLNGGVGTRVAAGQPKQFIVVKGIPILVYSLVAADAVDTISQIVLNYPRRLARRRREDRHRLRDQDPDHVRARPAGPGTSRSRRMLPHHRERARDHPRVGPAAGHRRRLRADHPRTSTRTSATCSRSRSRSRRSTRRPHRVTGSLDRDTLRNVQLPQKFSKSTLVAAHEYAAREGVDVHRGRDALRGRRLRRAVPRGQRPQLQGHHPGRRPARRLPARKRGQR